MTTQLPSWFRPRAHRGLTRFRQNRPLFGTATALLVSALSASVLAVGAGDANAAQLQEIDLAWADAPASVPSGGEVRGVAHINLNDASGATTGGTRSVENDVVTLTATNGVFEALPTACKTGTTVAPVSSISDAGTTLVCNLGTVEYGTAIELDWTITASGSNGDLLSVSGTDGASTGQVGTVPIKAIPGIDVVFDSGQQVAAASAWQHDYPLGVTLPVGAAPLAGPIAFDITVANDTSINAVSSIVLADSTCHTSTSTPPSTSQPWTSANAPVPAACQLTQTAPGRFHVVMSGYKGDAGSGTSASSGFPTKAMSGAPLRTDRRFFAEVGIPLTSTGISPSAASFMATVSNVVATTADGRAVAEVDATNNQERTTMLPPGGYTHVWARYALAVTPWADNAVSSQGALWDASPHVLPGDHVSSYSSSKQWGSAALANIPVGATWEQCAVLDGPAHFSGRVKASYITGPNQWTRNLPAGTYHWEVFTGPTGASGARDSFSCGAAAMTRIETTTVTGPDGIAYDAFSGIDPTTVTAIDLVVDPRALASAFGGYTPIAIFDLVDATVDGSAPVSSHLWTFGAFNRPGGSWSTAAGDTDYVRTTPGQPYAGTSNMEDVITTAVARGHVSKDVIASTGTAPLPDAHVNDTLTYRITTADETNVGTTSAATWSVTDTLPAGLRYIPGSATSATPPTVTTEADGSTTLRWDLAGPYNTDTAFTYRAAVLATSGVLTNVAVALDANEPSSAATTANGGRDSVDVLVTNDGRTYLTKTVGSPVFAAGSSNTWDLGLENRDSVDQAHTDIIDVLPWNGDARGTHVTGTQTIESVTSAPGDSVFYATTAPRAISTDPDAASNGAFAAPSAIWSATLPTGGTGVTAIRIVGGVLAQGATKHTVIAWRAVGGKPQDRLENVAWAKATHTRLQMIKAASAVTEVDGSRLQIAKKHVSQTGWKPGDRITYRISVHNASRVPAYDVEATDLGGNGNDPSSVTWSTLSAGSADPASRDWKIGTMAAGATESATIETTIAASSDWTAPFSNTIRVANPSNPSPSDHVTPCVPNNTDVLADTDQCDVAVLTPPRLKIDKAADPSPGEGMVAWTIHTRLDGSTPLDDVVVTDHWPAAVDRRTVVVTRPPTQGTFDAGRGLWNVGTLTPGTVAAVSFTARVSAADLQAGVVNEAVVSSPHVPQVPPGRGSHTPGVCQPNDGPTIDAALDADTDQCDVVRTPKPCPEESDALPAAAACPAPRANTPAPDTTTWLPNAGGPSLWVAGLGLGSGAAAVAVRRRRVPISQPSHRAGSGRRRRPAPDVRK